MTKKRFLRFLFILLAISGSALLAAILTRNSGLELQIAETKSDLDKNTERISDKQVISAADKQIEKDETLQTEADRLLNLFDKMPSVSVYIKDEPVIKSGTNVEKAVAYTICETKQHPQIYVKKVFYQKANRKQLVNILKHEMTHAWFCRQGIAAEHDARFRKKFESIGGFGN